MDTKSDPQSPPPAPAACSAYEWPTGPIPTCIQDRLWPLIVAIGEALGASTGRKNLLVCKELDMEIAQAFAAAANLGFREGVRNCENLTDEARVWIGQASAPVACSPSDAERLEWLIANSAYVSWSRDMEVCTVWYRWDHDRQDGGPVEGYPQKCHYDAREAIDAAMRKPNAELSGKPL